MESTLRVELMVHNVNGILIQSISIKWAFFVLIGFNKSFVGFARKIRHYFSRVVDIIMVFRPFETIIKFIMFILSYSFKAYLMPTGVSFREPNVIYNGSPQARTTIKQHR